MRKTEAPIKETMMVMMITDYYQLGILENISNNVKKFKTPDSIGANSVLPNHFKNNVNVILLPLSSSKISQYSECTSVPK